MNSTNNYSVRVLWDHQPNYNQVLGDGTIDTLYTEKDDDVDGWSAPSTGSPSRRSS